MSDDRIKVVETEISLIKADIEVINNTIRAVSDRMAEMLMALHNQIRNLDSKIKEKSDVPSKPNIIIE